MSKHQYVEDGKVYEVDKDTNSVKEVGTVAPTSGGFLNSVLDTLDPANVVNAVGDTIDEALNPSSGKK
jgi:hypothetical protein